LFSLSLSLSRSLSLSLALSRSLSLSLALSRSLSLSLSLSPKILRISYSVVHRPLCRETTTRVALTQDGDGMSDTLRDGDAVMGDETPTRPTTAGGMAATGDTPIGTSVYVGNLSWDTRWQGLKDHMRKAGDVLHAEVFTESSGRSAGCGVVEYASVDAATAAIETLNETLLDGRNIFVRVDREHGKQRPARAAAASTSTSRGAGGGGYGDAPTNRDYARGQVGYASAGNAVQHGRNGAPDEQRAGRAGRPSDRGRKIVVWNLPYHIRWQDLKDLFRDFGPVIRADVQQTADGKSKGMGTVLFESEADALRAIDDMTGKEIDGRVIDCRLDRYAQ
jgi:RNA recognition motif. (a.k.a. RRM, RBD, or RNP domain)